MTSSDAVIRAAVPADLPAVTAINAHYVANTVITFEETPPTVADWRARLADLTARGFPFLVADVGGEVAGYAYAGPWRPKPAYRYTVEDSVYLAPGLGGRGLGGALLGAVIDGATAAGLRRMVAVIADAGDDRSIALHRRHGFTEVGRLTEVGFKLGRWVDTTLMERPLT
ncbi:Phosphinothricin N-acetyltransferase [Nonomuraea coxensis DSM 45129]|uniref:Phosphinothricin N-acetyltransferase n=1 Tax=Nonomuraea coxensis DSM 45129 TaxID=1122611 RepID=A0ABX8UDE1_9ACTN|nr:GNAT family N-acetyltransferase [Nonomuraea coxensis]QYC45590.1 Phosphinothricin N-acetyltransferase [Nonomuraea coxensis DSM 45129]